MDRNDVANLSEPPRFELPRELRDDVEASSLRGEQKGALERIFERGTNRCILQFSWAGFDRRPRTYVNSGRLS